MKEKIIRITVESDYGTTIIKEVDVDSDIENLMQNWKEIVLGLGYHPECVNEYID